MFYYQGLYPSNTLLTMNNQNRRAFLKTGTLAALSLLTSSCGGRSEQPDGSQSATGTDPNAPYPSTRNGSADAHRGIRLGVIDINGTYGGLAMPAELAAVEKAARIGFEGLEITFGGPDEQGLLRLAHPDRLARYRQELQRHGIKPAGTHLFVLHRNKLKDPHDPLARRWVEQAIPATRELGTEVVLLPFFGDAAIETRRERAYVAGVLGDLGAMAAEYGVVLGLENSLSAEDNMRLLEQTDSEAVKIYYDVGNSIYFGYDIYEELSWLGSEPICQIHIKDHPFERYYLGEGIIDFDRVFERIARIGYTGWLVLETHAPSGDIAADMRRNLTYVQGKLATHVSR